MDAVIARQTASHGRPAITYRHAGDQFAEYNEMELDLRLNFSAIAVKTSLDSSDSPGITESAPGYRSLMVGFDRHPHSPGQVIEVLDAVHAQVAIDGTAQPLSVGSLCIHGNAPKGVEVARVTAETLAAAGSALSTIGRRSRTGRIGVAT